MTLEEVDQALESLGKDATGWERILRRVAGEARPSLDAVDEILEELGKGVSIRARRPAGNVAAPSREGTAREAPRNAEDARAAEAEPVPEPRSSGPEWDYTETPVDGVLRHDAAAGPVSSDQPPPRREKELEASPDASREAPPPSWGEDEYLETDTAMDSTPGSSDALGDANPASASDPPWDPFQAEISPDDEQEPYHASLAAPVALDTSDDLVGSAAFDGRPPFDPATNEVRLDEVEAIHDDYTHEGYTPDPYASIPEDSTNVESAEEIYARSQPPPALFGFDDEETELSLDDDPTMSAGDADDFDLIVDETGLDAPPVEVAPRADETQRMSSRPPDDDDDAEEAFFKRFLKR